MRFDPTPFRELMTTDAEVVRPNLLDRSLRGWGRHHENRVIWRTGYLGDMLQFTYDASAES